ncbi:hypothetical protein G195_000705 [Phytophthora kernoviae 00238/432]|uniref:Glutathione peroxidase n=1 Tax=Phytophthora kernoviae 00238/432 TaxID=1284355 RepID=A0A8J4WR72_9STRA|nr:hypothetical protein G195_000705 [Phytophthora kernoviae 00238/432]
MDGHTGDLSAYESKVLLIVNTASKCSYSRQFTELQQLYEQYCVQGLEILAFPCNQFNHKEPGSNDEVAQYCRNHFHISFPMFEKIEVTGQSMHPLFRYLERHPDLYRGNGIKWNFTKFLIDRTGEVSGRYETTVAPVEMEFAIKDLLMRSWI